MTFNASHIEILKDCEISDEFKEKIIHLANTSMKDDERVITVCQNFGIELEAPQMNNKEE